MRKILILLALSLLMIKSYSQESNQKTSEFGGLFSTRIDSRHYSDFEVNGFGVEGGVYYLGYTLKLKPHQDCRGVEVLKRA
ncbi:hypothetical protein [Phaeodactylibacter xiamenensis]|uniref:hypothetical protein n=1 Tax=Phaeodactylibacter xiamenensis TaxID=1524460 RepID=UPI003CCC0839